MQLADIRADRVKYALLVVVVILCVLLVPVPAFVESGLIGAVWNAGHAPLFAFACFTALLLLAEVGRRSQYFVLAGICLLGAATEYAQRFTGRSVSWIDLFDNLLGIAVGFAVWRLLFDARVAASRGMRTGFMGVVVVCTGLAVAPLVVAIEAQIDHARRFPVLFDAGFSGALAMTESLGELDEVAIELEGEGVAVHLLKGPTPGLVVWKFKPDWRGYDELVVDLENPGAVALELGIHVRDKDSRSEPSDWFFARTVLGAHERRQLRYRLADVAAAPPGRRANLADMSVIAIHRSGGTADRFVLHSVALE